MLGRLAWTAEIQEDALTIQGPTSPPPFAGPVQPPSAGPVQPPFAGPVPQPFAGPMPTPLVSSMPPPFAAGPVPAGGMPPLGAQPLGAQPPGAQPPGHPPLGAQQPGHPPVPYTRPPSGLFPGPTRPIYREPHPVSAAPVMAGLGATALWFGLFGGLAHDFAGYAWWTLTAGLSAWAVALVLARLGDRGAAVGIAIAGGIGLSITVGLVATRWIVDWNWPLW